MYWTVNGKFYNATEILPFRMSNEFTVEMMKDAVEKGDWGTQIAKGDHFYRALFRTERKPKMKLEDVKLLFASYNEWIKDTEILMKKCEEKNTRDDRAAITAAEKLILDVTEHMHEIIIKVQCEQENLIEFLTKTANGME